MFETTREHGVSLWIDTSSFQKALNILNIICYCT